MSGPAAVLRGIAEMSIQASVLAFVLFVLFVVSPDEDLDRDWDR